MGGLEISRSLPTATASLRQPIAIALAALMVLSSMSLTSAATTLDGDEECDVSSGESIQDAIDQADPYTVIVVCEATYKESLTIPKNGIQLLGKGTPILDGDLLGATHGITIAEGVQDVEIANFEIRDYDADLEDDPSSGIASQGHTYNVTIRDNTIHDNAWAGVLAADGDDIRWTVEDNHLDKHGFAHVFIQDANGAFLTDNWMASSDQAVILADTEVARIEDNTVHGGGNGAITLAPGLGDAHPNERVAVHNNTITGQWDHGIWIAHAQDTRLTANNASVDGTAYTVGADPAQVNVTTTNVGSPSATELTYAGVLHVFQDGAPTPPEHNTTLETVECNLDTACSPLVIEDLFDYALLSEMNPFLEGQDEDDAEKIEDCEENGWMYPEGPEGCLRAQFFRDSGNEPNSWRVDLQDANQASGESYLRFIDAGLRRPGEDRGEREYTDDLEGNWTTLVICQLVRNDVSQNCQSSPQRFAFGLNLNRAPSDVPRHTSGWRLMEPGAGVHARFDRIHGTQFTLFKRTTPIHTAESSGPGPIPSSEKTPSAAPDQRVEAAGQLQLACQIETLSGGSPQGCNSPRLASETLSPDVDYCPATRPNHASSIHDRLGSEAKALWDWSSECRPIRSPQPTNWTTFFTANERQRLAQEHEEYYNASSSDGRTENQTEARRVYEQALARQLALNLTNHGMPTDPDQSILENVTTTSLDLAHNRFPRGAVATAESEIYVFAGSGVVIFNPEDRSTGSRHLDVDKAIQSAIYTGDTFYLFAGTVATRQPYLPESCGSSPVLEDLWCRAYGEVKTQHDRNISLIYRWDPGSDPELVDVVEIDFRSTAAVWDPREISSTECPDGCGYIFGTGSKIVRFNAFTERAEITDKDAHDRVHDAVWTGDGAVVLEQDWIEYLYEHWEEPGLAYYETPSLDLRGESNPDDTYGASLSWSNGRAYLFGGCASSGCWNGATDKIRSWPPGWGQHDVLDTSLPTGVRENLAAQVPGDATYIMGTNSGHGDIQRFVPPVHNNTVLHQLASNSTAYNIVELQAQPQSSPNVNLTAIEVLDNGTWRDLQRPSLAAFTPIRLTAEIIFEAANASTIEETVQFVVEDEFEPRFTPPNAVEYGNETHAGVTAFEPSNLNYTEDYLERSNPRSHSIPLVNATAPNTTLKDAGLQDAGLTLPGEAQAVVACARELHTAAAKGAATNLDPASHPGGDRLAYASNTSCQSLGINATRLRMHAPLSLTLLVREGAEIGANLSIVDDPTHHITNGTNATAGRTLSHARTAYDPSSEDRAIQAVTGRIVVTLPSTQTKAEQARAVGSLISAFQGQIGVFGIAIDDLPNPPALSDAVTNAVQNHTATILTGAGVLPEQVRSWRLENKLMTVDGLAAHPLVLTVGSGTNETGVSAWSRRGPTPDLMGPKPDLLAPSPTGSTAGAVYNLLPFVEALGTRGLHGPNLAKAVLSGVAWPTHTEAGTPATYYSQGLGVIDLGSFLDLPSTSELVGAFANRTNLTTNQSYQALANRTGTTPQAIQNASSSQILGAAAQVGPMVRAAISQSLVNLTLNAPALPRTSVADFGLVNHNRTAQAKVGAVDLDPLVNATLDSVEHQLRRAGYNGVLLNDTLEDLTRLFDLVAENGQDVTLNVTHYYYPQLLSQDYLYTTLDTLVDQAQQDVNASAANLSTSGVQDSINHVQSRVGNWTLDPHHLVREAHGKAHLDVGVEARCNLVPVRASFAFARSTTKLIHNEATRLAGTTKASPAQRIVESLPDSPHAFLSKSNAEYTYSQGTQLACAEDQKRLLETLRRTAQRMRGLQSQPYGAWNQTEMVTGSWNLTPLGHQLGNTTDAIDPTMGHLHTNTTLVMDTSIDALTQAIGRLEGVLNRTGTPVAHAEARSSPPGVFNPSTIRERTRDTQAHPLGGYVGLARMTSTGLNVTNPFANGTPTTHARANVTVPIPSLLWNNPTLDWREAYRDGTPAPDTPVQLETRSDLGPSDDGGSLESFNTVTVKNDINVSLAANATERWQDEARQARNLSAQLANLTMNYTFQTAPTPFGSRFQRLIENVNATVANWSENATCAARISECPASLSSQAATKKIVDETLGDALDDTFSHSNGFRKFTNATGELPFRYLPSGSFKLTLPYPYPIASDLDREYAYQAPGTGWFDGPVNDTSMALHEQVQRKTQGWPAHPTAQGPYPDWGATNQSEPTPPDSVEQATTRPDWMPYLEAHKETVGPVHPFSYNLSGPDLPGFACLDTQWFSNVTGTSISYPGCGLPPIPDELVDRVNQLRAHARCILDLSHQQLSLSNARACEVVREQIQRIRDLCLTNQTATQLACDQLDKLNQTLAAIDDLQRKLGDLARDKVKALIPFARSPRRGIAQNASQIGLNVTNQVSQTQQLNPNATRGQVEDAVNDTLRDLEDGWLGPPPNGTSSTGRNFTVDTPPRRSTLNHSIAHGIAHRMTDRVSGLDWVHLGTNRVNTTGTEYSKNDIANLTRDIAQMANNGTASDLFEAYAAEVEDTPTSPEAFEAGLKLSGPATGAYLDEGWRANGTVTLDGYHLSGQGDTKTLAAEEVCTDQARLAGNSKAYQEPCGSITATVGPESQGLGGVDKPTFANVLLEELRTRQDCLEEPIRDCTVADEFVNASLTKAAGMSAVNPDHTVRRSEETFLVKKEADHVEPAVGALLYSTPVPIQEHMQYRVDGKLLLENSAALVVTTANPAITQSLVEATRDLDENVSGGNATAIAGDVVGRFARVVGAASQQVGESPLVRADLVGFPVKVEEKTNIPQFSILGGQGGGGCGTVMPSGPNAETELCEQGLVTAQPDGLYNYTTTYEMKTRERGVNGLGPRQLHTLVVYFPSTSQSDDTTQTGPAQQTVALHNVSIQAQTFLGLDSPLLTDHTHSSGEVPPPSTTSGEVSMETTLPLRYRANLEEYKRLTAVPEAQLKTPERGLSVSFSMTGDNQAVAVGYNDSSDLDGLVEGLSAGTGATCPDGHASGVPTDGFIQGPRGMGAGFTWADPQSCLRNGVHSLQPVHIPNEFGGPGTTTSPTKGLRDALQYEFNVAPLETFSYGEGESLEDADLHPLNYPLSLAGKKAQGLAPPTGTGSVGDLAGTAQQIVARELTHFGRTLPNWAIAQLGNPLVDIEGALPFLDDSWIQKRQLDKGAKAAPPLSNWAVIDEAQAFRMANETGNLWNPQALIDRTEVTQYNASDDNVTDVNVTVSGHQLPDRERSRYQAGVLAHEFNVDIDQGPYEPGTGGQQASVAAKLFTGMGTSGLGIALEVTGTEEVRVGDQDMTSFLDGHTIQPEGGMTVKVSKLGGDHTAGSDCTDIPLYDYVKPYFRCTGASTIDTYTWTEARVGESCYDAALELVEAAQVRAMRAENRDLGGEPPFQVGTQVHQALEKLSGQPLQDPVSLAPGPVADEGAWHAGQAAEFAPTAAGLLLCVKPMAGFQAGFEINEFLEDFNQTLDALVEEGSRGSVREGWVNATWNVDPERAENGEPPHYVDARVAIDGAVRQRGAIDETGTHNVTIAIDEWTTNVSSADVSQTNESPNGSTETSLRARYNSSQVNVTFEDNVTLDLQHATTYTLNASAEDVHGWNTSDEVAFVSDVVEPNVSGTVESITYTKEHNLSLTWTAEDATSGLHRLDAWVCQDTCQDLDVALPDNRVGTTDPVTVNATADLGNSSTGDVAELRFEAEDRAGNVNISSDDVTVDRQAPDLAGAVTNVNETYGFVMEDAVNATYNATEDGPAGLAEIDVLLHNRTEGTFHQLERSDFEGAPAYGNDTSRRPWPNTTYGLTIHARDQANNTVNQTVDTAEVQIVPELEARVPHWEHQLFHDLDPHHLANISVPGYPTQPIDEVAIDVVREFNRSHQEYATQASNVSTAWLGFWNGTEAPTNEWYNVSLEASHGAFTTIDNFTIERPERDGYGDWPITAEYNDNTERTRGVMYGELNGKDDQDELVAWYQDCDDDGSGQIKLRLEGFSANGTEPDVDLHTKDNRHSVGGTWRNATGPDNVETMYRWVDDNEAVTVIAASNTTERIGYEIRYTTDCREPDNDPDDTFETVTTE